MATDPRFGEGCGFATVPVRTCKVCLTKTICRNLDMSPDPKDDMVLCPACYRFVRALQLWRQEGASTGSASAAKPKRPWWRRIWPKGAQDEL